MSVQTKLLKAHKKSQKTIISSSKGVKYKKSRSFKSNFCRGFPSKTRILTAMLHKGSGEVCKFLPPFLCKCFLTYNQVGNGYAS